MPWIKKLKKLNKLSKLNYFFGSDLKSVLIPFILLVLVILAMSFSMKFFAKNNFQKELSPAQVIKVSEPFSAKFYFNDEFNTNIFSDAIIEAVNSATSSIEIAVFFNG